MNGFLNRPAYYNAPMYPHPMMQHIRPQLIVFDLGLYVRTTLCLKKHH